MSRDRSAASLGRHRREAIDRQRRLVEDGSDGWALAPVTRPTHYVGRVGVLAAALGVGVLLSVLPAAAYADSGSENSGDTVSSSESVGSSGRAADRDSRTPARGPRGRGSSAPAPGPDASSVDPVTPRTRGADVADPVEPISSAAAPGRHRRGESATTAPAGSDSPPRDSSPPVAPADTATSAPAAVETGPEAGDLEMQHPAEAPVAPAAPVFTETFPAAAVLVPIADRSATPPPVMTAASPRGTPSPR